MDGMGFGLEVRVDLIQLADSSFSQICQIVTFSRALARFRHTG